MHPDVEYVGARLIWANVWGAGPDKAAGLGSTQGTGMQPMEGQAASQLQQQKAVLTSLAVDPGMPHDNTHTVAMAGTCCLHSQVLHWASM